MLDWKIFNGDRSLGYAHHRVSAIKQAQSFTKTLDDIEVVHMPTGDIYYKFDKGFVYLRKDGELQLINKR
jgi:hypothetical protein